MSAFFTFARMSLSQTFYQHQAQTTDSPYGIEVESAEGIYIYDTSGKRYMDLISGVAVSNVGHRHPKVVEATKRQLDKYMHVMVYGEYIQKPQAELAEKLTSLLPNSLDCLYPVKEYVFAILAAPIIAPTTPSSNKPMSVGYSTFVFMTNESPFAFNSFVCFSVNCLWPRFTITLFILSIIFLTTNIISDHKKGTAIHHLSNHLNNEDNDLIISNSLVNFYLKSTGLKSDYINIEKFKLAHSYEQINSAKRIKIIGKYSNLFAKQYVETYDTSFYHNPYMNRMWSGIPIYTLKNKNEY